MGFFYFKFLKVTADDITILLIDWNCSNTFSE